ncbi:MAG TPA: GFA family protein [Caulobacteraceae bacterium]|jgi:hypothetical protein|nr:GFA family protein [Caulobacteraceae bacterium]
MLTGSCHCGRASWTYEAEPDHATACNCTLCRRTGGLWAYGYEGEGVAVAGPVSSYIRADEPDPSLANLFCPSCGNMVAWRGLKLDDQGRRRMAVNLRLADPDTVAAVPVERFDGLDSWRRLPSDGRCVRDMAF